MELSKLNFNFDDIRTNFLQVLTYNGSARLLSYDDTIQNYNRMKQNRAELILTIKIYGGSFM